MNLKLYFWVFFLKREKNEIWRCVVGQLGRWEVLGRDAVGETIIRIYPVIKIYFQ